MHLGGMDRAPGPITSEARNLSMRPRNARLLVPAPTAADVSVETWVKFVDREPHAGERVDRRRRAWRCT